MREEFLSHSGVFLAAALLASWAPPAFATGAQDCQDSGGRGDLSAGTCICAQTGGPMTTAAERSLCLKETTSEIAGTLGKFNSNPNGQAHGCNPSPLVFNTNLACPKQLLQEITLSDNRSSLFGLIGSPDSMCASLIDSQFNTAADLEKYLSSAYPVGASPTMLSSSCLANFSDYSVAGHPSPLDPNDAKQAVATYYDLMNRVNNGAVSALETIASIDSLLGHPLLNGVSCSDPRLTAEAAYCAGIARQHCQPQNGFDAMSAETLQAVQSIQLISSKMSAIEADPQSFTPTGMGLSRTLSDAQAQQVNQYQQAIQAIESLYPWVQGAAFQKYLSQHKTGLNFTGQQPADLAQIVHDATYSQVLQNRAAAVQQLSDMGRAGQCLNTQFYDYNECKDLNTVIGETPPLPGLQLTQTSKAGTIASQQLSNVDCRWQIAQDRDAVNGVVANTAIGIGLTIATAGVSSVGMAAKAELALLKAGGQWVDGAKAADLTAQAAAASNILMGTNIAFAADGLKQVGTACLQTLTTLDQQVMSLPSSPKGESCPSAPGAGPNVVIDQSRSCGMAVAMAAVNLLPLATPAILKIAHAVAPDVTHAPAETKVTHAPTTATDAPQLPKAAPAKLAQSWQSLPDPAMDQQLNIWQLEDAGDYSKAQSAASDISNSLETKPIVNRWPLGKSSTHPDVVELNDGTLAILKKSNPKAGFSPGAEVAAYRLDQFFGGRLHVPVTVTRTIDGSQYSLQLWVKGSREFNPGEEPTDSAYMNAFDYLIDNSDRRAANMLLYPKDNPTRMMGIDNGNGFANDQPAKSADGTDLSWSNKVRLACEGATGSDLAGCTKGVILLSAPPNSIYEKLKTTPDSVFRQMFQGVLSEQDIDAFLTRRQQMIAVIDQSIASGHALPN